MVCVVVEGGGEGEGRQERRGGRERGGGGSLCRRGARSSVAARAADCRGVRLSGERAMIAGRRADFPTWSARLELTIVGRWEVVLRRHPDWRGRRVLG